MRGGSGVEGGYPALMVCSLSVWLARERDPSRASTAKCLFLGGDIQSARGRAY